LPAISILGPVYTPGTAAGKSECREIFSIPLWAFMTRIPKSDPQKNFIKNPGQMYSLIVLADERA
jgi:hypothetical protein